MPKNINPDDFRKEADQSRRKREAIERLTKETALSPEQKKKIEEELLKMSKIWHQRHHSNPELES